jgi:hypothetical protein
VRGHQSSPVVVLEGELAQTLWHPWLRINRVLRVMLQTRWSAEAWSQVRVGVQESARASERDPTRGMVQLMSLVQVGNRPRPREIGRFSVTLIREIH